MQDIILTKLKKSLLHSNNFKSSYWSSLKFSNDLENIYGHFGFGTFEKKKKIRNLAHTFFQFLIYGNKIFKMEEYKKIKLFLEKFQRQIDIDVIKHLYVFNLLKKKIKTPKSIAVIGDGKANFITNAFLNYPNSVLYSINLPEVLIHDYFILKNYEIYKESDISVVENESDLSDKSKKLFFITPNNIKMLLNLKIELFVNICSFQEIKNKDISKYFDLIKANESLFYCCNRRYKKLPDGEEIIFKNYPWGKGKKIFEEECPWLKNIYFFRPPFIKKYDGPHDHKLINYKAS